MGFRALMVACNLFILDAAVNMGQSFPTTCAVQSESLLQLNFGSESFSHEVCEILSKGSQGQFCQTIDLLCKLAGETSICGWDLID